MMNEEIISYTSGEINCQGYAVIPESTKPLPVVIIAHAWRGLDDFAKKKAREVAELGYIGFAIDVYGEGQKANNNEQALSLMLPLFLNRALLRERVIAGYEQAKKLSHADKDKITSIGFCFGGTTALELLRSGAKLCGTISVHGVLGDAIQNQKATRAKIANQLYGSLLFLHGDQDPLVSENDLSQIKKEFTQANIDWEMVIFSHTMHAFTNPLANEKESGLLYNRVADRRSTFIITQFLKEVFNEI